MSIVVVGSVAYDTIETRSGRADDVLGGSASYFALAARFFSPVSIVAAVGADFAPRIGGCSSSAISTCAGWSSAEGRTMRWHGRYHEDMNKRDTLGLALNVFSDFAPELLPDQRRSDYLFLANIAPELQEHVLSQMRVPRWSPPTR